MQVIDHVLLHLVFSTKGQRPVLADDALRADVFAALRDVLSHSEHVGLAVGGTADHVHVALYLSRKMTVNKVVEHLKKASAAVVRRDEAHRLFAWQKGFFVFSVGLSDRDALIKYVDGQVAIHAGKTFQQEMRGMFAKYDVGFDERFCWK